MKKLLIFTVFFSSLACSIFPDRMRNSQIAGKGLEILNHNDKEAFPENTQEISIKADYRGAPKGERAEAHLLKVDKPWEYASSGIENNHASTLISKSPSFDLDSIFEYTFTFEKDLIPGKYAVAMFDLKENKYYSVIAVIAWEIDAKSSSSSISSKTPRKNFKIRGNSSLESALICTKTSEDGHCNQNEELSISKNSTTFYATLLLEDIDPEEELSISLHAFNSRRKDGPEPFPLLFESGKIPATPKITFRVDIDKTSLQNYLLKEKKEDLEASLSWELSRKDSFERSHMGSIAKFGKIFDFSAMFDDE